MTKKEYFDLNITERNTQKANCGLTKGLKSDEFKQLIQWEIEEIGQNNYTTTALKIMQLIHKNLEEYNANDLNNIIIETIQLDIFTSNDSISHLIEELEKLKDNR